MPVAQPASMHPFANAPDTRACGHAADRPTRLRSAPHIEFSVRDRARPVGNVARDTCPSGRDGLAANQRDSLRDNSRASQQNLRPKPNFYGTVTRWDRSPRGYQGLRTSKARVANNTGLGVKTNEWLKRFSRRRPAPSLQQAYAPEYRGPPPRSHHSPSRARGSG